MEEIVTEVASWFSSQTTTTCEIDDPVGGTGVDTGVAAGVVLGEAVGADVGVAVGVAIGVEVGVAVGVEVAVAVAAVVGAGVAPAVGDTITARLAKVVCDAPKIFGEPVGDRRWSSRGERVGLTGPFNHLAARVCTPRRADSGTETRARKEPSSAVRSRGMPVLLPSHVS